MGNTEIEELIEQTKVVLKKQCFPKLKPKLSKRTWQEILDGKPSPQIRWSKP